MTKVKPFLHFYGTLGVPGKRQPGYRKGVKLREVSGNTGWLATLTWYCTNVNTQQQQSNVLWPLIQDNTRLTAEIN